MQLAGKVALVTGGATGIGRAIVLALAREGAAVAVNYSKSADHARATARDAEKAGVRAITVRADVSQDAQARAMVTQVASELGGLDLLVNNAGWTRPVPHAQLEDLTDDVWEGVLGVNVRGAFYCVRAAVPHMAKRGGGAVVNITSVAGFTGEGSSMAYAASKAALGTLTKSLARALAPQRIRVNAVAPGLLATGFGGGFITEEIQQRRARVTPTGRLATVDELAGVVVFLLANESMTGATTIVDGGFTTLGPADGTR